MRLIALRKPASLDGLHVTDGPDPGPPGSGEIRVRVRANSLNYHDYAVVTGMIPTVEGRIPMADGAGVVDAIGQGVDDFVVGDHVVSCFFPMWHDGPPKSGDFATVPGDGVDGFAREYVVRPAYWFTHVPAHFSHAEAATLPTAGLTAWRALVGDGKLKAGDTVLVLGSGGVSVFALQFAKLMGATVIATTSSEAKQERLRALGAAHTINYRTQPDWGARVLELTEGRGVDHVVEVGGPGTLPQSITAVRIGGHISLIGILTGRSGEVPTVRLMAKQARLQGLIVGSREQQIEMVRAIEATGLKPVIDCTFPLEEMANAFRHEASGAHVGKICLEY